MSVAKGSPGPDCGSETNRCRIARQRGLHMSRIEKLHHTGPRDLMRISLSHWALALALALAVLPHAGSAGVKQASLSPMFDAHTRFKPNEIAKLRFRVQDGSGAPVPEKDV